LPKCNAPPNPSSNNLIEATAGLTYGFYAISSASLRTIAWGCSLCCDIGHLDLLGVAGKRCTIVVEQHEQRPFRRKIGEAQQDYEIGIEGTIERSTTDPPSDAFGNTCTGLTGRPPILSAGVVIFVAGFQLCPLPLDYNESEPNEQR
jgi:hypothetical protein